MSSLMQRYNGDFEKVCRHYAEKLTPGFLKKNSTEDFVKWMVKSKDYYVQNPLVFDPLLYWHCYAIHVKINDPEREQQHIMVSTGKVGTGKTTLLAQVCALIDPTFNSKRVYYLPEQFFRGMINAKPGEAHMIDEGGNFFKSINTSAKNSRLLSQYLQMARSKRLFLGIAFDDYHEMMKDVRGKVDSIVIKGGVNEKEESDYLRSVLILPVLHSVKVINQVINSHKMDIIAAIKEARRLRLKPIVLKGWNSKKFPAMNGINADMFKEWKKKNVKAFEEKISDDIQEFGVTHDSESKPENRGLDEFMPVAKYARINGFHPDTIRNKVKSGIIPGKFMLGKWVVNITKATSQETISNPTPPRGNNILSNNTRNGLDRDVDMEENHAI